MSGEKAFKELCLSGLISVSCIVVSATRAFGGGAWVHEPNKFYGEGTFGYYRASDAFTRDGDRRSIGLLKDPAIPSSALSGLIPSTYEQFEGNLYVEYGLPLDLEFSATFPFYREGRQVSQVGTFHAAGIGDAVLGLKYKWFEREWLLSAVQFEVGVPAGNENATGSLPGQNLQPLPLGDGEWDYALRVYASRGFQVIPAYVSADFGYRFRTSNETVNFVDDLPWNVEGGYVLALRDGWFSELTTTLAFRGLVSTGKLGISTLVNLSASGNGPNQEFIDVQPGISLKIAGGCSLVATFSYTLTGKNTGAGWTLRNGLSFQN